MNNTYIYILIYIPIKYKNTEHIPLCIVVKSCRQTKVKPRLVLRNVENHQVLFDNFEYISLLLIIRHVILTVCFTVFNS